LTNSASQLNEKRAECSALRNSRDVSASNVEHKEPRTEKFQLATPATPPQERSYVINPQTASPRPSLSYQASLPVTATHRGSFTAQSEKPSVVSSVLEKRIEELNGKVRFSGFTCSNSSAVDRVPIYHSKEGICTG
jgi:hypothetical protein